MKKLAFLLAVVALFLVATVCPAMAAEPYRRVVIPATGLSVAVQPMVLGEDPNHVTAWAYDVWPQAFFMHRNGPGADLAALKPGDTILLHKDWCAEDAPLRLWVLRIQVIAAGDEDRLVLDRVGGNTFALITCHPANDPTAPQRLVVWATAAGPRRALWR